MPRTVFFTAAAVALLLSAPTTRAVAAGAAAQPTAMSDNPCPPPKPADAAGSAFLQMLLTPGAHFAAPGRSPAQKQAAERAAAQQRARDWADLCRYRADNAALTAHPRVVLMGDSITDFWRQGDPALFDHGIVDRGISGQTSGQMLLRFWPDVIALQPRIVQILAGTNDIAGNTGPTTEQDYESNIMAMVTLAQAHHIRVLLGAIPPAVSFWWTPHPYRPAAEILRLNEWLRRYARSSGCGFVDYYTHLSTPAGAFRPDLSNDGVHPNADGYRVMTTLLQAGGFAAEMTEVDQRHEKDDRQRPRLRPASGLGHHAHESGLEHESPARAPPDGEYAPGENGQHESGVENAGPEGDAAQRPETRGRDRAWTSRLG